MWEEHHTNTCNPLVRNYLWREYVGGIVRQHQASHANIGITHQLAAWRARVWAAWIQRLLLLSRCRNAVTPCAVRTYDASRADPAWLVSDYSPFEIRFKAFRFSDRKAL